MMPFTPIEGEAVSVAQGAKPTCFGMTVLFAAILRACDGVMAESAEGGDSEAMPRLLTCTPRGSWFTDITAAFVKMESCDQGRTQLGCPVLF